MKLVTYRAGKRNRIGVVLGDYVADVGIAIGMLAKGGVPEEMARQSTFAEAARVVLGGGAAPREMLELLERGEAWRKALDEVLQALSYGLDPKHGPRGLNRPLKRTKLGPPITYPRKITCVGHNYLEHIRERGAPIPKAPMFFLKSHNTIIGTGDAILLPPNSPEIDFEAELAIVIGKRGRRIREEDAFDHIAGYLILNDISARDMQRNDVQWFRGKSCDTFAPIGPYLVTRDEVPDPHNLRISLTLNGQTMQDSNTGSMIFKIPFLISYLSRTLTWEPGDILSTGTPEGVGSGRTPPVFMKPGDNVSITIEKIGTLTNPVTAP